MKASSAVSLTVAFLLAATASAQEIRKMTFELGAARNELKIEIAYHDQDRLSVFPALELFDCLNRLTIERIGAKPIESVGAKGDDAAFRYCVSDSN